MDDQNQQPVVHEPQPKPQAPPTIPGALNPNQVNKPALAVSDQEAQAVLTINNIQAEHRHGRGPSVGVLISIGIVIVIAILASFALGSLKPNTASKSNTESSSQSGTNPTKSTTDEVNQDINTCSNPLKAAAEC